MRVHVYPTPGLGHSFPFMCSLIHSNCSVTLAYTPGYSGLAQPLPQDTTPIKEKKLPSFVIKGPPESPEKGNKLNILSNKDYCQPWQESFPVSFAQIMLLVISPR